MSIFLTLSFSALAEEVCVNKAPPENDELIRSFRENTDPLKKAFLARNLPRTENKPKSCTMVTAQNKNLPRLGAVSEACEEFVAVSYGNSKKIKDECLVASTNRRAGRDQYVCGFKGNIKLERGQTAAKPVGLAKTVKEIKNVTGPNGKKVSTENRDDQNQCFNQELLDYMKFAVAQITDCLGDARPIDLRAIYKKINDETAFNFSVSSPAGRGLMQITTIAAQELSNDEDGNGTYILRQVAESKKASCAPFRLIAERDLSKQQRMRSDNLCDWLNPGDGLARSLLYGVGYHVHMRDTKIIPALKKLAEAAQAKSSPSDKPQKKSKVARKTSSSKNSQAPNYINDADLISLLTTMSFGREGIQNTLALLNRLRAENLTPSELKAKLKKRSVYLSEIEEKQEEALCIQKGAGFDKHGKCKVKFSDSEMAGNTCVTSK